MDEQTVRIIDALDFKKRSLINDMKYNFSKYYKDNFSLKEFNFFPFASYCHAYADYLLNGSEYNEYGNFVEAFNSIIEEDETYNWMKRIQHRTLDPLSVLTHNYSKAKISDSRFKINGEEFANEIDLEKLICDNFEHDFGGDLKIKRQQVVGYGRSDILINQNIVIELKKSLAKRKDVYQAFEYSFQEGIEVTCLIAQGFSNEVLEIAERLNVQCYRYAFGRDPEATGDYPVGIFFEKVLKSPTNEFDKILDEADNSIIFSNYNHRFDFNDAFLKQREKMKEIFNRTAAVQKAEKKEIIRQLEAMGYDTSKGLEILLEEIEKEKRA